jgi:hypothetical protein
MKTRKATGFILLTGVALFSLSFVTGSWAADKADTAEVDKLVDSLCSHCH